MPSSTGPDTQRNLTAEELSSVYQNAFNNSVYGVDIYRVLQAIIDRDRSEDSETATLEADIADLARLISINTKEIAYLHRLLALLIFELIEQGIEIESKELLNELKLYLKKNGS